MEIRIGLPALHLAKQGPIKGRTGEYGQMNVREGKRISHIHGYLQRVIPTFIMKRHPMYILIRIISATLVYERHLRTKRPFFILTQRNIRQTRYAETEAGSRLIRILHFLDQRRISASGTYAERNLSHRR